MERRLIPERTVDSMLAIEIVSALPQALIWSPTNTAGSYDHEVYASPLGKPLVFECKGTYKTASGAWRSPIDRHQLSTYAKFEPGIWYLFPTRPVLFDPWIRKPCSCNPIGLGHWDSCLACDNHGEPRTTRRNAAYDPSTRRLPMQMRFQPWFSHWCWVVPAEDLERHLLPSQKTLPTDDTDFFHPRAICQVCRNPGCPCSAKPVHQSLGRADRLCHLLARLQGTQPDIFRPVSDEERLRADSVANLMALAADFPRTSDSEDQSGITVAYVD